jgi:hypothetical protein
MRGTPAHGLIGEWLNPNDRIFSTMAVTVASMPAASAPPTLAAIPQSRGNAIDGEVDTLHHALVGIASAVALD